VVFFGAFLLSLSIKSFCHTIPQFEKFNNSHKSNNWKACRASPVYCRTNKIWIYEKYWNAWELIPKNLDCMALFQVNLQVIGILGNIG